MKINFDEASLT